MLAGLDRGLLAIAATALVYFGRGRLRAPAASTGCGGPRSAALIIGLGGLIEPRALGVGYDVIDANC